ncbi:MAG TPA: hypothetical protein PK040_06530 [Anaerolineaceae bacterium]|nr:hypothetical protein [Anaerolineaceae bacterium]
MSGSALQVFPMPVDIVQKVSQADTGLAQVDPGKNPRAFCSTAAVNKHVFSPAIPAANFTTKAVPEPTHFPVKMEQKGFVLWRKIVKPDFVEDIHLLSFSSSI